MTNVRDMTTEERKARHVDGAGNDGGGSESEIVELVPGERIVLHWQFVGPDRTTDPAIATRLTVTFTPHRTARRWT